MTSVLVPFTFPTCTSVLFSSAALPFPTSESKYVVFVVLSHPQALYIWHKQVTGRVSFWPWGCEELVRLWKL